MLRSAFSTRYSRLQANLEWLGVTTPFSFNISAILLAASCPAIHVHFLVLYQEEKQLRFGAFLRSFMPSSLPQFCPNVSGLHHRRRLTAEWRLPSITRQHPPNPRQLAKIGMAVKAIVVDDSNIHHLIVGLNRENVESILRGDVFTLPRGAALCAL